MKKNDGLSVMCYLSNFGMVSSVGHDVISACSSIRAGISRPSELNYDALDEDMMPVSSIGHPVSGFTDGYYFIGRWLRLAERALTDFALQSVKKNNTLTQNWYDTKLIIVIPDTVDRYLVTAPIDDEYILQHYVQKVLLISNININLKNVKIIRKGHVGAVAAIDHAVQFFQQAKGGQLEMEFLVLAVDSYVESTTLNWLSENGRLKSADKPAGLIPGEAAVCFLLERDAPDCSSLKKKGFTILGCEIAKDEEFENFGNPNPGRVLADTIISVLKKSAISLPFSGDVIIDINGESWRSKEFGCALTSLQNDMFSSHINVITPCSEIGDVGAASGAVALSLASHAYLRDYSSANETLIVSQAEDGSVGVACVRQ